MNDSTACSCGSKARKHLYIPPRGPFESLENLGINRTGAGNAWAVQVAVPEDWHIQPSNVSAYHYHLVDGSGRPVACLLYKSSAGSGTFQMTTDKNCADKH